jgi:hypothetical protein
MNHHGEFEIIPHGNGHVAADVHLFIAEMGAQVAAGMWIAYVEIGTGIIARFLASHA